MSGAHVTDGKPVEPTLVPSIVIHALGLIMSICERGDAPSSVVLLQTLTSEAREHMANIHHDVFQGHSFREVVAIQPSSISRRELDPDGGIGDGTIQLRSIVAHICCVRCSPVGAQIPQGICDVAEPRHLGDDAVLWRTARPRLVSEGKAKDVPSGQVSRVSIGGTVIEVGSCDCSALWGGIGS